MWIFFEINMPKHTSNNKRIVRNTLFLTVRMVIVLFVNLYTTRIILNTLGVEDLGIYSVVGGLVTMFTFLNTSMSNGIQRYYNFELGMHGVKGGRNVYHTAVQIQLLLGLLILVLTETIGLWYLHTQMVIPSMRVTAAHWLFQLSILSFLISIMQVPYTASIVAHERMDYYALVGIIDVTMKLLISLLVAYLPGDHLIVYGALLVIVMMLDLIAYYVYAKKEFQEIRWNKYFNKELFISMISFSGWNVLGTFASIMKEQGINMVLNVFFGPIVNAARGISYQVMGGLNGFSANISITTRPQLIKSYAQGDTERTIWLYFMSSKLCFMAILVFAIPVIIEIRYILQLWLGDAVPQYTDTFTCWVLLIAFINNLNGPTSAVVHATGKMRDYQLITSLISLSVVPLTYVAYRWGATPETAFIIAFVVTALCQIISIQILKGLVGLSISSYLKEVICPLLLVVISTFTLASIPHELLSEGILRMTAVSMVSILFGSLMFFYIGLKKTERTAAISAIRRKIKTL